MALFASEPRDGFDAVLWLDVTGNGALLTESHRHKKTRYQNLMPLHAADEALVGLDVLTVVLETLRTSFGAYALLFAGEEDALIGVVWKQTKPLPFTITNTKFARPSTEAGMLEINTKEVLHAMVLKGNGLVVGSEEL
jgi:hypothetical protein